MTQRIKNNLSFLSGSTGAHESFLEKCGVFAIPEVTGAHGSAGVQDGHDDSAQSRTPGRSQMSREHNSSEKSEGFALHSRAPEEMKPQNTEGEVADWGRDAERVIAQMPDAAARAVLTDYYDQSVQDLQHQGKSLGGAQQDAFGMLLFCILRAGFEIPSRMDTW